MSAGSEANNEQAGGWIAERGDGFSPVLPVVPPAAFGCGDAAAVFGESRFGKSADTSNEKER